MKILVVLFLLIAFSILHCVNCSTLHRKSSVPEYIETKSRLDYIAQPLLANVATNDGDSKEETKEFTVCKGSSIILNAYTIFHELLQKAHDTDEWLEDSQIKWSTAKQLDNPHVIGFNGGYDLNDNQTILHAIDLQPNTPKFFIAKSIDLGLKAIFELYVPDCSLVLLDSEDENEIQAYKHERVILQVKAVHDGIVSWRFNGKFLDQSNKSSHFKFVKPTTYGYIYGSVLEIHNIKHRHSGIYEIFYDVSGCQCSLQVNITVNDVLYTEANNNFDRKFLSWLKSKKNVWILIASIILVLICSAIIGRGLDIIFKRRQQRSKIENEEHTDFYKTTFVSLWKGRLKNILTSFKKKKTEYYSPVSTKEGVTDCERNKDKQHNPAKENNDGELKKNFQSGDDTPSIETLFVTPVSSIGTIKASDDEQ